MHTVWERNKKIMKKTKLICFDIDGTIMENKSSFAALTDGLGCDVFKVVSIYQAVVKEELPIPEGEKAVTEIYRKSGKANKKFINRVFEEMELKKDAKELLPYLKEEGWKIYLVSGGMDMFVKMIASRAGVDGYYFNSSLKFGLMGDLKTIRYGGNEGLAKARQIKELAKKHSMDVKEMIFVGDSENDYHAFVETGHGIAVKPFDEKLGTVAWKQVDSLLEIKSFL
jgi:HAD superfamily phosphoserine phosphatase-like hydrolase